jgi:uncharacterized protein YabE (DUF348 family)
VLGATDRVSLPVETVPTEGLVVTVTRVTVAETVEQVAVPFAVERPQRRRHEPGREQGCCRPAARASCARPFAVETVDGKVTGRRLVREQQVPAP